MELLSDFIEAYGYSAESMDLLERTIDEVMLGPMDAFLGLTNV